mgnify:CR=1 FL=1
MRRAFLLLLVAYSLPGLAAKRLNDYAAMSRALDSGQSVRIVVQYAKTKLVIEGKEEEAPNAVGGMVVLAWERFERGVVRNAKAYVSTSETVLIAHPSYGYVQNYVRFRLYEDNTVQITARYLKPNTLEVVMDETFEGRISNGKDKEGVSVFAAD